MQMSAVCVSQLRLALHSPLMNIYLFTVI